jgi:hypothetical protein
MDLTEALLTLLGSARDWSTRARGFAFLLALPLIVVSVADWRIRRRR